MRETAEVNWEIWEIVFILIGNGVFRTLWTVRYNKCSNENLILIIKKRENAN